MKRTKINPLTSLITGFILLIITSTGAGGELQSFPNCTLVKMSGADGDSFKVQFLNGRQQVIRLYGVDCLEAALWDEADGTRLIEQRSYFGIRHYGGDYRDSIALAKHYGKVAGQEVEKLLSKPFTVHTAFADGRGSGYHKRVYAFVTTSTGEDLGVELVRRGLARAHGVDRSTPQGNSKDEMEALLADWEFFAARLGKGVWAHTDWQTIVNQRADLRADEAEKNEGLEKLPKPTFIVNPNTAPRDKLMTLDGVGETIANRIIEHRPYSKSEDLLRVKGLGEAKLVKFKNRLPKGW